MNTAILGGGLAGLTLGSLLEDGFTIYEREAECGGLCRSEKRRGFTFDRGGSHIIFSRDEGALRFMLDALGGNVVRNRRDTRILLDGRYIKYPFENGLAGLPPQDRYECLLTYVNRLIAREKGAPAPKNFREWIPYTFGEGMAERYMIPYNEKIWSHPLEDIALDWVEGRVPSPPVEDVIRSAVGIETEGYLHQLHFFYPQEGGIQALPDSLAARAGGRIRTGSGILSIRGRRGRWTVDTETGSDEFDRLVSTIPLQELAKVMDLPEKVSSAIGRLWYNSLVTVVVGAEGEGQDLSWLYVPGKEDGRANRVSFPSNFSPMVAPEGCHSLLAEITCKHGDEVWGMEDAAVIEESVGALARLGLVDPSRILVADVFRSRYAYVINDHDRRGNMAVIERYFKELGVSLCGRFSEFEYLNMDATVDSAKRTVGGMRSEHGGDDHR